MKAKGKDECLRRAREGGRKPLQGHYLLTCSFPFILGRSFDPVRLSSSFFFRFKCLTRPGGDLACEQPHLCEFTFPRRMATLPPKVSPKSGRLYGEAAPERGTFFRFQVYKRVRISWVMTIYERVRNFGLNLKCFELMHLKAVSI